MWMPSPNQAAVLVRLLQEGAPLRQARGIAFTEHDIMNQKASLQLHHDGIAVVTLQNPPVNALHPAGVLPFLHVLTIHLVSSPKCMFDVSIVSCTGSMKAYVIGVIRFLALSAHSHAAQP